MQWSVVGHSLQKQYFEGRLSAGTLSHAYLLDGPEGIGKRMLASEVATSLLSGNTLPLAGNPDVVILEPGTSEDTGKATDISVESARTMKVWAYQRPLYGTAKVVIIDGADRLSDDAANTLLKVLEEPPSYLYFFAITAHVGGVLPTVRSRCEAISFKPLADEDMDTVLQHTRLDADDRKLLRAVAAGRPGEAVALVGAHSLPDVARSVAGLERMIKSPTAERLFFARDMALDDELARTVSWWLAWTHAQLETRPTLAPVAHGLLELASVVGESKYNRRLALERFVLALPA